MKTRILFILILVLTAFGNLNAQPCHQIGIVFETQTQIDSFLDTDCTVILNTVEIVDSGVDPITNLDGLSKIQTINGSLNIKNNNALENLSGLVNLKTIVVDLTIKNNDALENLSGLDKLETIGTFLNIEDNDGLLNLSGLEQLNSISGFVQIKNNDALDNLSGLDNLKTIDTYFELTNNPDLRNVLALNKLSSVGGHFQIGSNDTLEYLYGLEKLETIGDYLTVNDNPTLKNLYGLIGLSSIGGALKITNNADLKSLFGIHGIIPNTITELEIINNDKLYLCDVPSICDFLVPGGSPTYISGNAQGCNSVLEVETACVDEYCFHEGVTFTTQQQIDDFAANYCTSIEGDVTISGDDINNLQGLNQIEDIKGNFTIFDNPSLININGLENLSSIGGNFHIEKNDALANFIEPELGELESVGGDFYVKSNHSLTSFTGFSILNSIGGNFHIESNFILENFSGLGALTNIGGYFHIEKNAVLENFSGLGALTNIGGYFHIVNNDALENFMGLETLESIGGYFYLKRNHQLVDLTAFKEKFESIEGYLKIDNNILLESLEGINNITGIKSKGSEKDLTITRNKKLYECHVNSICVFLGLENITTKISGNATGCKSKNQIKDSCALGPLMVTIPIGVIVQSNQSVITWSDDTPNGDEEYEIEYSKDGYNFTTIGHMYFDSKGQYDFIHENPESGDNYYRIKQVSFDGMFRYSDTETINLEAGEFSVYPNPAQDQVTVSTSQEGNLKIYNQLGRLVKQTRLSEGTNEIDLSTLSTGIYIFKTETGGAKRVVVQ